MGYTPNETDWLYRHAEAATVTCDCTHWCYVPEARRTRSTRSTRPAPPLFSAALLPAAAVV